MNKGQVWLQVFLSAMQALIQSLQNAPAHQIASSARMLADESMTHIHPSVFDIETGKPIAISPLREELGAALTAGAEDEMERARRQGTQAPRPTEEEEAQAERAQRA